jgi:omega-amidase
MKAYCCQLDIAWENKSENCAHVERKLSELAPEPGSLIVLAEMFATGFSMDVRAIHEPLDGPTEKCVAGLARRFKVFIVAGVVTRGPDAKGRNEAVVFDPAGQRICRYAKIHPFALGKELESYSRGDAISSFTWQGLKVTPFICYDLRFPEIFRSAVRQGTEIFVVIANWPAKRVHHWTALLQARAIENLAYVVGVNRSGTDPQHVYPGRSLIVDPHGTILADAGTAENIVSAEIDAEVVRTWRQDFPALQDMHWKQ